MVNKDAKFFLSLFLSPWYGLWLMADLDILRLAGYYHSVVGIVQGNSAHLRAKSHQNSALIRIRATGEKGSGLWRTERTLASEKRTPGTKSNKSLNEFNSDRMTFGRHNRKKTGWTLLCCAQGKCYQFATVFT